MKKIFIIALMASLFMISAASAADASDWSEIELCGETFKVPSSYSHGTYLSSSYEVGSFRILCLDDMLVDNYGFVLKDAVKTEDLTIGGHHAKYIQYGKGYSRIYFDVGDSIYSISWFGSNITDEIREIISSSARPSYSSGEFYSTLDQASADYNKKQESYFVNMDPDDDFEDFNEYRGYYTVEDLY